MHLQVLAPLFTVGSAAIEDIYTGPPLNFTIAPTFISPPPVVTVSVFVFTALLVLSQSLIHLPSLSSKDRLISSVSSSSLSVKDRDNRYLDNYLDISAPLKYSFTTVRLA